MAELSIGETLGLKEILELKECLNLTKVMTKVLARLEPYQKLLVDSIRDDCPRSCPQASMKYLLFPTVLLQMRPDTGSGNRPSNCLLFHHQKS